jgi:hypothetical protein
VIGSHYPPIQSKKAYIWTQGIQTFSRDCTYILSRFNRLVPRTDIYQSQNRRFPYDPSPKNLTIPRRLTTIVIKDETTFTETYKKGEHVSAVLDFHCVGVRVGWTFLCVGVCVGGGVATSSLFVCLLPNSFRSLSKPNVLASSPVTIWMK